MVTDVLCQIMGRGSQLNLMQDIGPTLPNGAKCSQFLYADDTIFLLADPIIIENVK
jgi:hypothetical protein